MTTSKGPKSTFSAMGLAVVAVLAVGGLAGCGDDTTNNSTTDIANPNPDTLSPKGTLQGQLTDAVTGAVIVGAVVNIGLQSAATDSTGHYVIYNVPANNRENSTGGFTGSYQATLDLSGVTSPVNMTDSAAAPRYPVRKPSMPVNVSFSSFDESANNGGTASNHDTPIVNLVANHDFKVGKLSATLRGVAGDATRQPKGGALVELRDANNNLETSTTTDTASGAYSFANVEAGVSHSLMGRDSDTSIQGNSGGFTLSDSQVLDLALGDPNALVLSPYDTYKPRVVMVSPENNTDVAAGAVDVVLTFNEPIKMDAYATPSAAATLSNIYKDVTVNFTGTKAGNVAHSMAWNTSHTALTVTIPAAAIGTSSKYAVDYNATVGKLKDMVGNVSEAGSVGTSVAFSTRGATAVTAPSVVVVNSASLAHGSTSVILDWAPVIGAVNGYKVYRAEKHVGHTGPMTFLANATTSAYTDNTADFVNATDDLATSYDYAVTAVNGDMEQSAMSTAVLARDVIAPSVPVLASTCVAPGGGSMLPAGGTTANGQIRITFSEPMPEAALETVANYTAAPAAPSPVVSAATQVATTQVVLEFSAAIACAGTSTVALTGITDLATNAYPSATLVTF